MLVEVLRRSAESNNIEQLLALVKQCAEGAPEEALKTLVWIFDDDAFSPYFSDREIKQLFEFALTLYNLEDLVEILRGKYTAGGSRGC